MGWIKKWKKVHQSYSSCTNKQYDKEFTTVSRSSISSQVVILSYSKEQLDKKCGVTNQMVNSQAVCKPQRHLGCPMSWHTQFSNC